MKNINTIILCIFIFSLSASIKLFADVKEASSIQKEDEAWSSLGSIKKEIPEFWWNKKDWDKTGELKSFLSKYTDDKKACAEAHFWIACNLYAKRKHEEAIKEYESILETCPREWDVSARSQFEIAQIYLFRLSKNDKALEAYMKTLDLTDEKNTIYAEAYRMIAVVYKRVGLSESASFSHNKGFEYIERYLSNNPDDKNALRIKHEMLWRIYVDLEKEENYEDAIKVLKQIIAMENLTSGQKAYAAMSIARTYEKAGNKEKALEWLEKVLFQENLSGMSYAIVVFQMYEINPESLTDDKIDKLLELTKDEDKAVRDTAVGTLCYLAVPRTLDHILQILENSEDEDTRLCILSSIGQFHNKKTKEILFTYLRSENVEFRKQASTSLLFLFQDEMIKDPSDVTALIEALKDEDAIVKENVSNCLVYRKNNDELLKPLKKALNDEDPFVRKSVRNAIDNPAKWTDNREDQ